MHTEVPVVDLFAGPGGLSEGFHRYTTWFNDDLAFKIRLSIEMDPVARETLRLRSFFRQFREPDLPQAYYDYVRAADGPARAEFLAALKKLPEWETADREAKLAELGEDLSLAELVSLVRQAKGEASDWILLGGPPCQAYSLIGRVRRTGIGTFAAEDEVDEESKAAAKAEKEQSFYDLKMHRLYRQYIGLLALVQPAVFIMENVKGILSSKDPDADSGERDLIFPKIVQDVSDPWKALRKDTSADIDRLSAIEPKEARGYKIYPFVATETKANKRYLIRCEDFGIPQERHRVILLGVRDDLSVTPGHLEPFEGNRPTVADIIGGLPKLSSEISARWRKKNKTEADWLQLVRKDLLEAKAEMDGPIWTALEAALMQAEVAANPNGERFVSAKSQTAIPTPHLADWYYDERLGGTLQHEARSHMPSDLARYLFAAAFAAFEGRSPKLSEFPSKLLPDHKNVQAALERGEKPDFADRFRVQVAGKASSTITSHISKDGHYFIHPDPTQCRSLTVREAARLQTFPDNYFFEGSQTNQYHQVGNAVPPYLAVQLASVVAGILKAARAEQRDAA